MAGRPKTETRWFEADLFIALRKGRGYEHQSDLALDIDIDQRQISNWETKKNDPSADQLVKISGFFNVSIDYLLGRSNDPQIHQLKENQDLKDRLAEFVTPENAPELIKYITALLKGED